MPASPPERTSPGCWDIPAPRWREPASFRLRLYIAPHNVGHHGTGARAGMILAIGNTKGGVGKTNLAVNLVMLRALAGRDVLLVDGDEQGTATGFTELRAGLLGEPGYTAVSLQGAAVRTQVRQMAGKYDDVLIDVGGRDTGSLRAALTVADRLLVPVQPRSFDVWAIDRMAELMDEARAVNGGIEAFSVLNAADAQGRDNDEAAAALREARGIGHLPGPVVRRKAFPNAAAAGRSVLELSLRDPKACEKLGTLARSVFVFVFVQRSKVRWISHVGRSASSQ